MGSNRSQELSTCAFSPRPDPPSQEPWGSEDAFPACERLKTSALDLSGAADTQWRHLSKHFEMYTSLYQVRPGKKKKKTITAKQNKIRTIRNSPCLAAACWF